MLECRGCHLADGSGSPDAVPALRGQVARFLEVPGGRAYLVRVPGSAQAQLTDAELAELLNWILRRFGPEELASRAEPYTAAEVARHRAEPLVDVESVRRDLVRQLARQPGAAPP